MAQPAPATRSATEPPKLRGGRIVVLLAILIFAASLRVAVTSLTPLLTRISADLDFGSLTIGLLGTMPTIMFGLAGFFSTPLARRFGLEQVALGAVVISIIGLGARAFSPNAGVLLVLSGVALAGAGVGNIIIPPLVKRYFSHQIAVLSTAYICFVQVGTVVPAAVAVPLADGLGWQGSLALWALVPLAALLPWVWVVWRRPAPDPVPSAATAPPRTRLRELAGTPLAWGMAFMFGMTSLVTYATFAWLPIVLTDAGTSELQAGAAVAVFSATGFAATFIAPAICQRFANPFGFVLFFAACMFAGFAGLLWSPTSGTIVWAILLGLGPTTFPMALTLINLRTRTSAGSASLSGFAQGVGYLLACAGPLLFGVLHDVTGGWYASFGFLTLTGFAMLTGAVVACRPRYLEDELGRTTAA